MNNKSIDGLKRRTDSETKKPTKTKLAVAQRRTPMRSELKKIDEQHDEAIRDFLSSVKDDDPTNLVGEFPERKEMEEDKKQKKSRGEKTKKPKKKHRARRIILWTLGSLFVIALGAGVWLYIQGNDLVSRVTGGNLIDALLADPDVPLDTDPKTGRTNILIFGTEGYSMDDSNYPGAQLTDSIMVASLDQDSGDVRIISLPRDWKTRTCNATSRLNEVYYCNYYKNKGTMEGERAGAAALAREAENILGIGIQYFVHVNWQALVQIVNTLGGIDVAFVYQGTAWTGSEVALETTDQRGLADYWDPRTQAYGIKFENGRAYHLDGEQALGVARSRNESRGYGAGGGNYSREQFQQKIIQAVIAKARKTNFVTDFMKALGIKDAVGDNLRMDFKDTELKTLFKLVGTIDLGGFKSISVEETDDGRRLIRSGGADAFCGLGTNGVAYSYQCPTAGLGNVSEIHAYVARRLSSDPVMSENAQIVVMNATSASGVASTEGNRLKEKGYNVVGTENAPAALGEVEGVKIYQKNKAMSGTAKALKSFYKNVVVSTTIPESLTNVKADFIIVIGSGYANDLVE